MSPSRSRRDHSYQLQFVSQGLVEGLDLAKADNLPELETLVPKKGERPAILDSHSEVSKDFIDQKARRKWCTKSLNPIFRCATPSTGQIKGEVVVKLSCSVPTTISPYICPVDGAAHRNIGFRLFVHNFHLAFWSIKSFENTGAGRPSLDGTPGVW